MNNKIKQLAEQSGISFKPFIVDEEEYDFEDVVVPDSDVLEKFAELIINECIKVCEDGVDGVEDWTSGIWNRACIDRSLTIKQRFKD